MKRIISLIVFALMLNLITGCGEDSKASAINKGLKKHPAILWTLKLPVLIDSKGRSHPLIFGRKDQIAKRLDLLVDVGVLSKKQGSRSEKHWGKVKVYKGTKYSLTEMGKKYYLNGKLVFGNYYASKIISFTEPATLMGKVVTEVKYKETIKNIAPWANDRSLNKVFSALDQIGNPKEKTAKLIKLSSGWEYVR